MSRDRLSLGRLGGPRLPNTHWQFSFPEHQPPLRIAAFSGAMHRPCSLSVWWLSRGRGDTPHDLNAEY